MTSPSKPHFLSAFTLRWVLTGCAAFWLGNFILGGLMLAFSSEDFTNAHGNEAREHYLGFIIFENLKLLKAYTLTTIAYTVCIFPLVCIWMKQSKAEETRRGVLWRTVAAAVAIMLYSATCLALTRPYFYSVTVTSWARSSIDSIPHFLRAGWVTVIPLVFLCAIALFYIHWAMGIFSRKNGASPRLHTSFVALAALILALTISSGAFSRTQVAAKPQEKPNILILASDSLRADRLSCNGYARNTTPAIDALAEKSVNFKKCFTPVGSTLESLITMMTSQYPHTHGVQHMYPNKSQIDTINANAPTLADELGKAGYETAVLGDWCAGIFNIVPLGFDDISVSDYDNFKIYISQAISVHHWVLPLYFDNSFGYHLFPELEAFAQFVTPETVTNRVVERLENRTEAEKPFFYTVFYSSTHLPYHCSEPYCDLFTDSDYDGINQYKMHFDVDGFISGRNMDATWQSMREREIAQIKGLYDGCVRQFDDNVGRILDTLQETGQLENTIVLITSDHGDDQLEPNTSFGHGLSFNGGDQSNHIPFILHLPGMTEGIAVDSIVRTLDFAPTLLDLAGAPIEPTMEGVSLVPCLQNPDAIDNLAFFGETAYLFVNRKIPGEEPLHLPPMDRTTYVDPEFDFHFVLKDKYQQAVLDTKERALRTERYKLVRTPGVNDPIFRLYDLRNDLHCETDISGENPQIIEPMKEALLNWLNEHRECRIDDIFPHGEPSPSGT